VIYAAQSWPSNAELIRDVAKLGYIRQTDTVLDPTFGNGVWWKLFLPDYLIAHDIAMDGVDFALLPEADQSVDVVAFDPPYVAPGGRSTSTLIMYGQYGNLQTPKDPAMLQTLINWGLHEAVRVVRRKGYVLVKCMNYVSSGHVWPGVFRTQEYALGLNLRFVTMFVHSGETAGPQPKVRFKTVTVNGTKTRVLSTQQHPRNNYSVLLVLRKP
jgi:tRNA G10  N-methylase Trm11